MEDITQKLTPDQWQIIKNMIDIHMKRNILSFSNEELEAGWNFIAIITCYLPEND